MQPTSNMTRSAVIAMMIAVCALALRVPTAAQAQHGLVITDQAYYVSNGLVFVVAILRNSTDDYIGDASARLQLYHNSQVYYDRDGLEPDKTVLAPGEETVLYVRWLPMYYGQPSGPEPPTRAALDLAARSVQSSEYPYIDPPEPWFVQLWVAQEVDWYRARLSGELRNQGPFYYKATEIPNEQLVRPVPFLTTAVFYNNGEIVGASRLFDGYGSRGHMAPGDSAAFAVIKSGRREYNAYRLFHAVEPLPEGTYAIRWDVEDVSWDVLTKQTSCGREPTPCRRFVLDAKIVNASDVAAKPEIAFVLRDVLGKPVGYGGCLSDYLDPESAHQCHVEVSTEEINTPVEPPIGPRRSLDDIKYVTAHITSRVTTSSPDFAAPPRQGPVCYRSRSATPPPTPPPTWVPTVRLFLPVVYQPVGFCGEFR